MKVKMFNTYCFVCSAMVYNITIESAKIVRAYGVCKVENNTYGDYVYTKL